MENNFMPEFNLGIVDALKDKAKKIGHFLFGSGEAPLHMSEHYEKSHFEPSDGEAYDPDKQAAIKHYVQLANDAKVSRENTTHQESLFD